MPTYSANKQKRYHISVAKKGGRTSSRKKSTLNRKFIKGMLVTFVVLLLSVLYIAGTTFYGWLNKSFVSAESVVSFNTNYTAVLYAVVDDFNADSPEIKKFQVKLVDKVNKKIITYDFPLDLEVFSGSKFGLEKVSKQFALAKIEHEEDLPAILGTLTNVAFNFIAFPIDRYVIVNTSAVEGWDNFYESGSLVSLVNTLSSSTGSYHTNFGLQELYQLSGFINSLPEDRFINNVLKSDIGNVIDYEIKDIALNSEFAKTGKSIAVLNAGGRQGAAGFGSRVLANLGGHIVVVDNSDLKFNENFIVADTLTDTMAVFIGKTLNISKIISKESAKTLVDPIDLERADIIVIIGQD